MDFSRLEKNICDVIKEEQIKLGYREETIRLYYPLKSLNRFLRTDYTIEAMLEAMEGFSKAVEETLGTVEVSNRGERFCLKFLPQASEYVHTHTAQDGFLYDFIHTISRHGSTIDDVLAQFRAYSDCVHVEKANHGEFDYLVYFEDGNPDDFRYCLTDEGCHIIYHRYTQEDYDDLGLDTAPITQDMTIAGVVSQLPGLAALAPWFVIRGKASVMDLPIVRKNETQGAVIVEALQAMDRWQQSGQLHSTAIYSEEEIAKQPDKAMTNLLHLPGKEGAGFVLILSGGSYTGVYNIGEGIPCGYQIAQMGYHAFILTYQVDGNSVVDRALEDVAAGLSHIFAHGASYGVSTESYAIMGMSAGGHLAASWGLKEMGYGAYQLPAPAAELLVYPAASMKLLLEAMDNYKEEDREKYRAIARKFMDCIAGAGSTQEDLLRYSVEEVLDESYPPTYVVHCTEDALVPVSTAYGMEAALKRHGVRNQIQVVEGGCHGFGTGVGMEAEGWLDEAITFWKNFGSQNA